MGAARRILMACLAAMGQSVYYPANDLGMNVPQDTDFGMNRIYSDRALAIVGPNSDTRGAFYNYGYVTVNGSLSLPDSSLSPTTGLPIVPFTIKLAEGSNVLADPAMLGTWIFYYAASAKAPIGYSSGAVEVSHTFTGGVGTVTFTFNGATSLILNVNAASGVTSFGPIFNPENSAQAIASGPGSVPRWNAAAMRTLSPYAYFRMMDVCQTNSDFTDIVNGVWATSVAWTDRVTPTNYYVNTRQQKNGGMPAEWQVDLCNTQGKNGWFNIPVLATDDYITQFATYIANNLQVGKYAMFELGNEAWNTGSAFYTYKKRGAAAMTEALAAQPNLTVSQANIVSFASDGTTATITLAAALPLFGLSNTPLSIVGLQSGYTGFAPTGTMTYSSGSTTITYPCTQASTGGPVASSTVLASTGFIGVVNSSWSARQYTKCVLSFASNGTTATVVFSQPHGATTGSTPVAKLLNTGYTGFAPTGTLTVVDSVTITYPCTQVATTAPLSGDTVINRSGGGFLACNGASTLFTGGFIGTVFDLGVYWFHRRQFEMATLVKAAFTAVGRSTNDARPCFMLQYATPYVFGTQNYQSYIRLVKGGAELNSVFKAASVGGYFSLNLSGFMDPGFGFTAGVGTPTDQPSLLAQLRTFVDHCYGAYAYPGFIAWCRFAGLETWCYESGVDTSTATGTAVTYASPANADPLMEGIVRDWIFNQVNLGFSKNGWYAGGAGFQSGGGCFNLGRTVAEIDPSASSSGWGAKFMGLRDALTTRPAAPQAYHAFPCTFSSYDAVGNEAVVTTGGIWPAFDMTNLPHSGNGFGGSISAGTTYRVWSEIARTVTFKANGHTTSTAQVMTVTNMNNSSSGTFTAPATSGSIATGVDFPTCSVSLVAGMNYILVAGATKAGAATVFPHTIQFS